MPQGISQKKAPLHYSGHPIRFITVMLQGCLSYTPIDTVV